MPRTLDSPIYGPSPRVHLSVPQWLLDAVDQQASDEGKTRPQAIRSLLAFALTGQTVAHGPDGNG